MRVLGIDPGSRIAGYAVIDLSPSLGLAGAATSLRLEPKLISLGVIEFSKELDFMDRLAEIAEGTQELLERFKPQEVAIENIFLGKNVSSAFKLGHARGVMICKCVEKGIKVVEYSTREVKKSVTSSGAATKEDVQTALFRLLGRGAMSGPLDATDALALAYHHVGSLRHHIMNPQQPLALVEN